MDKQEYKILSEEIKTLSANRQFAEAAEIADQIDWRKVRSFSTLMNISEIYQLNYRYEDALELMLMAYDRNPKNGGIVYALCELYILMNDSIKSLEFFGLYKRIAPKDTAGHYILQYKIQEMQGASLDDQIALLEMFTRKEYREEWVYQLAYLYHRIGLGTKCVETCNRLIATFGEGPFVIKALELKMLHARLRPDEQRLYDQRDRIADELSAYESDEYTTERPEPGLHPEMGDPADWHVKTIDMSKFNTIAMQNELAKSMRELMEGGSSSGNGRSGKYGSLMEDDYMSTAEMEENLQYEETEPLEDEPSEAGYYTGDDGYPDDHTMFIPQGGYAGRDEAYAEEDGTYEEDGEYAEGDGYYTEDGAYEEDGNYAGDGEYAEEDGYYTEDGTYEEDGNYEEGGEYAEEDGYYTEDGAYKEDGNYTGEGNYDGEAYSGGQDLRSEAEGAVQEDAGSYEPVFAEEHAGAGQEIVLTGAPVTQNSIVLGTGDLSEIRLSGISAGPEPVKAAEKTVRSTVADGEVFFEDRTSDIVIDSLPSGTNPEYMSMQRAAESVLREERSEKEERAKEVPADTEVRRKRPANNTLEDMFYTAPDGQMGLAVPKSRMVEKQITGQIEITDYLAGWEEKKRRQSEAQKQALERRINDSTGPIFAGYDERMRNSMIEDIAKEQKLFADKYRADDIEFRSVDEVARENRVAQPTLQRVTQAAETAEGPVITKEAPAEGRRSIWDEVQEAMEADQERERAAEAEQAPVVTGLVDAAESVLSGMEESDEVILQSAKISAGSVGLVDAAVSSADALLSKHTGAEEASVEETSGAEPSESAQPEDGMSSEAAPATAEQTEAEASDTEEPGQEDRTEDQTEEEQTEEAAGEEVSAEAEEEAAQADADTAYPAEDDAAEEAAEDAGEADDTESIGSESIEAGNTEDTVNTEEDAETDPEEEYYPEDDAYEEAYEEEAYEEEYAEDDNAEEAAEDIEEEEYYPEDEYEDEAYDGEYEEDEAAEDAEYQEDGEYPDDGIYEEYDGEYADEDGYEEEQSYEEDYETDPESNADDAYLREILKGESDNYTKELPAGLDTAQLNELSSVLEADADRVGAETVEEINDEYDASEEELSPEEQELFREFLYSKKMAAQILEAVDQISLAPYVGNAIVTGDADSGVEKLGKALIKEIQMIDGNFLTNRIARISGNKMNRKDIPSMFAQLGNGALLVEKASDMNRETLEIIARTLDNLQEGLFVIFMDSRKNMEKLLERYELITGYFNARVDILPMNNNALVEYAKKYAYSREYKIDEERGVLALHQKISERQIGEHNVSTREIEEIINAAIDHSSRPHLSTFFRILSGKRYDYEDMIILWEKDFL